MTIKHGRVIFACVHVVATITYLIGICISGIIFLGNCRHFVHFWRISSEQVDFPVDYIWNKLREQVRDWSVNWCSLFDLLTAQTPRRGRRRRKCSRTETFRHLAEIEFINIDSIEGYRVNSPIKGVSVWILCSPKSTKTIRRVIYAVPSVFFSLTSKLTDMQFMITKVDEEPKSTKVNFISFPFLSFNCSCCRVVINCVNNRKQAQQQHQQQ